MSHKCPGMNPGNWKISDIKEHKCPKCGYTIEFWKDDIKRECTKCKRVLFNPELNNLCLSWCEKAHECIGNMDIEEWKRSSFLKIKNTCIDK